MDILVLSGDYAIPTTIANDRQSMTSYSLLPGGPKKVIPLVQCNICTRGITFFGPLCIVTTALSCLVWRYWRRNFFRLKDILTTFGGMATLTGGFDFHDRVSY